jgi:hypothetical protein
MLRCTKRSNLSKKLIFSKFALPKKCQVRIKYRGAAISGRILRVVENSIITAVFTKYLQYIKQFRGGETEFENSGELTLCHAVDTMIILEKMNT